MTMKRKLRLILTALLLLFANPVFSQVVDQIEQDDNNGEVMSLFEIERLIRKTDYTEALRQLNIYIEKKPDYFDNAQRLVRIIMNRRKQYSVLAERAIRSSTENPEDHETPAKIILQMRSIEKNPPAEIKRMIDMLEEMHLFKYYAYLFDKIQTDSAALTESGDYFGAINLVREQGFDIYKDEYYDQFEIDNPEMNEKATQIVDELSAAIAEYMSNDFQNIFDSVVDQILKQLDKNDYSGAVALYGRLEAACSQYTELRNRVYDCGQKIKELYAVQTELDSEVTDASYLPFMQRFILGVQVPENSGILGAIDGKYSARIEQIKMSIAKNISDYNKTYLAALPEVLFNGITDYDSLGNKQRYTADINNYAELGKRTNSLYSLLKTDSEEPYAPYPQYDISVEYEKALGEKTAELMLIVKDFETERILRKI